MKEYKNKTRQEICNKLWKIRNTYELESILKVVDLFIHLDQIGMGKLGFEEGKRYYMQFDVLRKTLSDDYSSRELSHTSSFMTGIRMGKEGKVS